MNEILVIELKIPWRYDLGWDQKDINKYRIEFAKFCIEDTACIEATLVKAVVAVGPPDIYNIKLIGG